MWVVSGTYGRFQAHRSHEGCRAISTEVEACSDQLRESAVWSKRAIFSPCRRVAADADIAEAVNQEAQQQLADGWVVGPFSASEMDQRHDGGWLPLKRFGVRRGQVRAVDDFPEFLVNAL